MRFAKFLVAVTLLAGLSAQADQYSFTSHANTAIPDGNPTGLTTTIDVTGVAGWIINMTVSLNVSGGANGDLFSYLYLDSTNSGYAVLLNRVGKTSGSPLGYGDAGMSVVFDDSAPTDIHSYGGNSGNPLAGSWQPDGRTTDPQLVLDADSRTALLDQFNTRSPNGTWMLFISDLTGGNQGTLVEWSLTIDAVPEPASFSLALLGGGLLAVTLRRRGRSRRS
jgi:subtilisin-like proprotein convertase family protein